MAIIEYIYRDNPQPRLISKIAAALKNDGVIVYPTDTIYGLGADLFNKNAINRILRIKKADSKKPLTFLCPDLKDISNWAIISNDAYKVMKRVTPGPYTFILKATKQVPKILLQKRKTVGIRIPDCVVAQNLLAELGNPLLSVSVPQGEDGYYTDPQEIADKYGNDIDYILDAGILFNKPSTIIDFSQDEPEIIREGAGDIDGLF